MKIPIVIKIGGSTLGNHDTTLEDLVILQHKKIPVVVVHGGGNIVTNWLDRLNISTSFVNGLRVTDIGTLKVVTAVLAGLVNKELVSAIWRLGGKAVGISGVDGNLIEADNKNHELGYTGETLKVDVSLLQLLLREGYIPVIAPISLGNMNNLDAEPNLLNVNGDTAAAEIAAALNAEKLIFLTDVPGLYDDSHTIIRHLDPHTARDMIDSGTVSGGMSAKIEACIHALTKIPVTRIIDGRVSHSLSNEIEGKGDGTTIAR